MDEPMLGGRDGVPGTVEEGTMASLGALRGDRKVFQGCMRISWADSEQVSVEMVVAGVVLYKASTRRGDRKAPCLELALVD